VWSEALKARGAQWAYPLCSGESGACIWRIRAGRNEGRFNDKRAEAPETAYGYTGGEKL